MGVWAIFSAIIVAILSYIAKESFANLQAGIRLREGKEIKVGDKIAILSWPRIPNEGCAEVISVHWRRTKLRKGDKLYAVQNKTILENPIEKLI